MTSTTLANCHHHFILWYMTIEQFMGIQLSNTKSRSTEDAGESTPLNLQVEFSEIHVWRVTIDLGGSLAIQFPFVTLLYFLLTSFFCLVDITTSQRSQFFCPGDIEGRFGLFCVNTSMGKLFAIHIKQLCVTVKLVVLCVYCTWQNILNIKSNKIVNILFIVYIEKYLAKQIGC